MHSHDAGRAPLFVRPPLHPTLVSFPIACIGGTLLTDIAYWQTANMQWANFSAWLLAAGLVVALFAGIAGLIDLIADRRVRALGIAWGYAGGNLLAWLIAIFNSFVHSRDSWTSVVPTGLILSALTVVILLVTGWMGWDLVYRTRIPEARP